MILELRIPLLGKQRISLKNESEKCYKKLEKLGEKERLENKIMHLGILHNIGDIPSFGRWVHVSTMLTLIEEIAMLNENTSSTISNVLGFGLNSKASLLNGAGFSSSTELLKSWAMIYSIGHFIGTFTSEHALLRSIVEHKREFIDSLYNELSEEDDILRDVFREIVENERIFGLFKIFTTLKVFEHFDKEYIELAKLNLLEEKYIEQIEDVTQREKIWNLLAFFKFVRKLSFTILDGYFSQNCVLLNHYHFLFNLDKVFHNQEYSQLLDDISLFYTRTIYQSPENMYYHHEFAKTIEKEVFSTYSNLEELIKACINNEIDEKIENTIQGETKRIKNNELPHVGRIILKNIREPVSLEKQAFKEICGGIIWSVPGKYYETDIYMRTAENLDSIVKLLESVRILYMAEKSREEIFERFESVSKNIVLKLLQFKNPTVNYIFDRRKLGITSIMFNKNSLKILKQKIEHRVKSIADKSLEVELKEACMLINELNVSDNSIYIYSPSVIVKDVSEEEPRDKVESDVMLMTYNGEMVSLKLVEIKTRASRRRQKRNQIKNYLMYFFGIDETSADDFAKRIKDGNELEKDVNGAKLYGKLDGNKAILELRFRIT